MNGATGGPRFFHEPLEGVEEGISLELSAGESRHAVRVLRLEVGAGVELFDGRGRVACATLERADPRAAVCRVESVTRVGRVVGLTVATAIPKGPRGEPMVEGLSQLGVDRLVPLASGRAVVRPGEGKLERYRRGAIESAKQCGRAWVMEVAESATFEAVLAEPDRVKLLLDPRGEWGADVLGRISEARRGGLGSGGGGGVLVLIGPEGGWEARELAAAEAAGCIRWRIGSHIMRIETAAVAAAAIVGAVSGSGGG